MSLFGSSQLTCCLRPGVDFLCNTNYDPFLYMEDNDKVYGTYSYADTIE